MPAKLCTSTLQSSFTLDRISPAVCHLKKGVKVTRGKLREYIGRSDVSSNLLQIVAVIKKRGMGLLRHKFYRYRMSSYTLPSMRTSEMQIKSVKERPTLSNQRPVYASSIPAANARCAKKDATSSELRMITPPSPRPLSRSTMKRLFLIPSVTCVTP